MNQIIAILVGTFGIGLAYFLCALFKHGLCDMGKMFNLLVLIGSVVTGVYLCIPAISLSLAPLADGAWLGVPGNPLAAVTLSNILTALPELFVNKVTPNQ